MIITNNPILTFINEKFYDIDIEDILLKFLDKKERRFLEI